MLNEMKTNGPQMKTIVNLHIHNKRKHGFTKRRLMIGFGYYMISDMSNEMHFLKN